MMLKLSYIKLFQILRGTRDNHFAQILEVFTAERMLLCEIDHACESAMTYILCLQTSGNLCKLITR